MQNLSFNKIFLIYLYITGKEIVFFVFILIEYIYFKRNLLDHFNTISYKNNCFNIS
jgi:hypothetical protein